MKNVIRHAAAPALLTLAFLTPSAWAQTPAPSAPNSASANAAAPGAKHAQKRQAYIEKRLSELHAQLKITAQQSSQWDAFAQTMRDSAQKTSDAYRDRAQKLPSMNAEDAMKSYAALAQMHADNTQKLAAAFGDLYGTMSDAQKKTADVLFRDQHKKGHGPVHKRKHAAPGAAASTPAPAPAGN